MSELGLAGLALLTPLCALAPLGKESEIHAVTMEGVVKVIAGNAMFSPCGRKVKLLSVPTGGEEPIPWPISTRGLPKPFTRCPKCWEITGRKRPAARFALATPKEQTQ